MNHLVDIVHSKQVGFESMNQNIRLLSSAFWDKYLSIKRITNYVDVY